jgi:hypothetical protein
MVIKLTNILKEIQVNMPSRNVVDFLNNNKKEIWNKVIKHYIDEDDAEEFNLPNSLKFIENEIENSDGTNYKVAGIEKPNGIGLDFSFDEKAVSEEDNPYFDTDETKIAGKTIYYCSYSI